VKYRLLQWLCCPACRSTQLALDTIKLVEQPICTAHFEEGEADTPGIDLERRIETEVMEGALHCKDCGLVYPIRDGIPRMMAPGSVQGVGTAHRLTEFDTAWPQWEANFRDLAAPMEPADFLGKLVLDAGCGFGRHAFFLGRFGAEVVAIDNSVDAVLSTRRNTQGQGRVHVVQGDLLHPPVRDGVFDVVQSFGVLHHLDDPKAVFDRLGEALKPGGRMAIWVYGQRQGLTRHASNGLRGMTSNMESEELGRFSRGIASALRVFSHTPYVVLNRVPVAGAIVRHLPVHDHHKWPFEIVVADIYDRLRVPVRHWFSAGELEGWLTEGGYVDVQVARKVGNNETFRAGGLRR
jgi:SAM-dependent methyltransferase/uncharacterized protein YbaR (Trm112 family)